MRETLIFLRELSENNNRNWFEANKPRYIEIKKRFDQFAEKLIKGIADFDNTISGLSVKDCTYRINRDTRFSANKEPYKTYMGIYACPKGKKSGYAGYYFQIEPQNGYGNILASGLHCPPSGILKSVRDDILVNGAEFISTINDSVGFRLDETQKLKRMPLGFPNDSQYSEYIKLKEYTLLSHPSDDNIYSDNLIDFCITQFSKTKPFVSFLNRSVDYYIQNPL